MFNKHHIFRVVNAVLLLALFTACSSSSYSNRFNRPDEKEERDVDNSVRFTSEEERPKEVEDETRMEFNNPSNTYREFDEDPVEDVPVNRREFINRNKTNTELNSNSSSTEVLLYEILKFVDTPYQYGGNTKKGIDCSAFTQQVYQKINSKLPRTAREQYKVGSSINRSNLNLGDLVFFNTTKAHYPGHVGIYIGDNLFAHASRSKGVTISSLQSSYYNTRYIGAKRIN